MKRCTACAGPFGLMRHYYAGKQFCSERCKSRFYRMRQQRIAQWRKALLHPNLSEIAGGFGFHARPPQ